MSTSVGAVGRLLSRGEGSADAADPYADPYADVRAQTMRLRAGLCNREPQPYPDWAGLPEGLLLQMFEIMTLADDGRQLVCIAGRVCRSWRVFSVEVLLRDTAISRPKRLGAAQHGRAAPAATSTLATQAACLRNADAVSSGVSSGEAISSKQRRLTGARHETESAPPSARLQLRDGAAAGPRAPREADSGHHAGRARRAGAAPADAAQEAADAAGAASVGGVSAGAEAAGQAADGPPARRRARDEADASDLAVVLSPAAGGVATGHESEEEDDAVEQRMPPHAQARWRTRMRMLADAGARLISDGFRGMPRNTRDANSGGGSAAR